MAKVILFKGKFKVKPPFNEEQIRDINNDYHFDEFDLTNDCLECKGTLREFRGNRGFKDIEYIIKNYKRSNKLKGEVIGLKFDVDRYKFCKWFIKYNKVKDEFIECNITKKGKPREKRVKPPSQLQLQKDITEVTIAPSTKKLTLTKNKVIISRAPMTKTLSESEKRKIVGCETEKQKNNGKPSLNTTDFYSLNEDQEVKENIIYAYMYMNNEKRTDNRKIAIENSDFMDCIDSKNYDLILKNFTNFQNKGVEDYEYIIFPFSRETEWILCIIEMKEKTIKIYDSEEGEYSDEVEKINKFLLHAGIKEKFKGKFISKPYHICAEDNGLHIMEYAKRWLLKEPINFTYEDMPRIRSQMQY